MALTTGFKRFISIVAIAGVVSVGLWQAQKNNYWGLLEKREQVVADQPPVRQATVQVPETPREVPAPVYAPSQAPVPVMQTPIETPPSYEAPASSGNKAAINKLKGMDKL